MSDHVLVSVTCPDQTGLVAAVTGCLFETGGNLEDTTFAVLGGNADFTAVVEYPDAIDLNAVEAALRALPELADANVTVSHFTYAAGDGPPGDVTHQITVSGGDRPGLVARLCEVFVQFDVNIIRLNAEPIESPAGTQYSVMVAVNIPDIHVASCLAAVGNTAGSLGLSCDWESYSR